MKQAGVKIQKVLADAGICSRRQAEELVKKGLISVDGKVMTNPAERVDLRKNVVEYNGSRITQSKALTKCLLLYKSRGFVTTRTDPHHKETVFDLLPESIRDNRWLYVGRLDLLTEGLLLFTDNGELAHRLTHPSYKIEKRYFAKVEGEPEQASLKQLTDGFELEGVKMVMDSVRHIRTGRSTSDFVVKLHQGEKRQVRRMFEHIGHPVAELTRIGFGFLSLKDLKPGEYRELDNEEVRKLMRMTKMK